MAAAPPSVESVILKLQAECYPKRIRPIEFFKDFDPLRKNQVTEAQFIRGLNCLMPRLPAADWEALIAHYNCQNGFVDYKTFCEEIERVFTTAALQSLPDLVVPPPGHQLSKSQLPPLDMEMHAILHRVALLNCTRGIVWKYCFEDADRGDSASLTVRRRAGKVTEAQFRRCFPLQKDFSQDEITRIVHRYRDEEGNVDYKAMHDEVTDPVDIVKDAPVPTSHYFPPPGLLNDTWSKENYSILERVTAKVIELRVRLYDYFQDFDPLRKGYCTVGQLDTVFGILGLRFSEEEMERLKNQYSMTDLNLVKFNYAKFCQDVNRAFTYDQIHTDPLSRIEMPGPNATLPARRSRLDLSETERAQISEIEEDIRSRVRKRRILFVNAFKDFDKTNSGHVTVAQFARVLQTLGLNGGMQDDTQTDLLAKKYCDLGSRNYFNFREFCMSCDPPSEQLLLAEQQSKEPYEKPAASRYFDETGKVYDVTDGTFK